MAPGVTNSVCCELNTAVARDRVEGTQGIE
jgi:hypothetical protein